MSKKEYFADGGSGVFTMRWTPRVEGDGNSSVGFLNLGYEQEPGRIATTSEKESVSGACLSIPIVGSWEQCAFENCIIGMARQLIAGNEQFESDVAQMSYLVLELVEPAIKQAIAQAIEEHLK